MKPPKPRHPHASGLGGMGTGDGYGAVIMSTSAGELGARRVVSPRLAVDPLRPADADELAALLDDISPYRSIGGKPAGRKERTEGATERGQR